MKQIKTDSKSLLVIPVPDKANGFDFLFHNNSLIYFLDTNRTISKAEGVMIRMELPIDKYSIIGKFKDIPENICTQIVDSIHVELMPNPSNDFAGGYDYAWKDYENLGEYAGYQGDAGCFREAKDSLKSLLTSNNIYIKEWVIEPALTFDSAHYVSAKQEHDQEYHDKLDRASEDVLLILIKE